ncbi:alanine--glyoxylate aminotransferase 2 homolog 1, mitochondrial-like [Populus alba]|uniref:alanine--glyoxylate aminotransferase 2 homolog 1, mitochondrial-like n=1 Tax=Populus alba TaxID=43335 RepID=UPI003CC7712A
MEQSKLHQHATTIYLSHTIADFAEALAAKMPGNLKVVYFVNSGSEANELAMLMARLYTVVLTEEYCRAKFIMLLIQIHTEESLALTLLVMRKVCRITSIMGVGGAVELAPGYLTMVYDIVRKAGGVCIADEVQSGFGHTGSHYWGFETQGVTPDIVTMAKGIGNGLPLGAVVTTPEIAQEMAQKIQFNANPV